MLIPFKTLLTQYNFRPTGVLHIGASHGEEFEQYMEMGIANQIWVEAIPEVAAACMKAVKSNKNAIVFNECIGNKVGEKVIFNITNNAGQSSSILPLKDHAKIYPTIVVERKLKLETITIDSLFAKKKLVPASYDFLNIDLQGAELKALQGAKNVLKSINYIYCEVNTAELYEGCPMVEEIDTYLWDFGFEPIECKMTDANWGDKFYMKRRND